MLFVKITGKAFGGSVNKAAFSTYCSIYEYLPHIIRFVKNNFLVMIKRVKIIFFATQNKL